MVCVCRIPSDMDRCFWWLLGNWNPTSLVSCIEILLCLKIAYPKISWFMTSWSFFPHGKSDETWWNRFLKPWFLPPVPASPASDVCRWGWNTVCRNVSPQGRNRCQTFSSLGASSGASSRLGQFRIVSGHFEPCLACFFLDGHEQFDAKNL